MDAAALKTTILCYGIAVNPVPYMKEGGGILFAEVEPSAVGWLRSWHPATRRWWYEVHRVGAAGEGITHAYEPGGSGGAYTFRACVAKAMDAVNEAAG